MRPRHRSLARLLCASVLLLVTGEAAAQSLLCPKTSLEPLLTPTPTFCNEPLLEFSPFPTLASLGDLDGDGRLELALGNLVNPSGWNPSSAASGFFVLSLDGDGSVGAHTFVGGPCDPLIHSEEGDRFGRAVVPLGDLNGDGFVDLAVGAPLDDGMGQNRGALYILFMGPALRPTAFVRTGSEDAALTTHLNDFSYFGTALAFLGDLDGDGRPELAVGAPGAGGHSTGAVFVVSLDAGGGLEVRSKIGESTGGFSGDLAPWDSFGTSLAPVGDLDADGLTELAVGSPYHSAGGYLEDFSGAVWILFLATDGTVRKDVGITTASGGFAGPLPLYESFGFSLAALGDHDGDGDPSLAVGGYGTWWPKEYTHEGDVWLLDLCPDGTVRSESKLSDAWPAFKSFGTALAFLADFGPYQADHVAVVSWAEASNYQLHYETWLAPVNAHPPYVKSKTSGSALYQTSLFGRSAVWLSGPEGDGTSKLAVGVPLDNIGDGDRGAVCILHVGEAGYLAAWSKIGNGQGGLPLFSLEPQAHFGTSIALADIDGDGARELLVGAPGVDGSGLDRGAVYVLSLDEDHVVTAWDRLDDMTPALFGRLDDGDRFGQATAVVGDLDGNGVPEIAVSSPSDDDGGTDRGALWILFLTPDLDVLEARKLSATQGGFPGTLDDGDSFGDALAALGDWDGDGIPDLAVGASGDDDGGEDRGAMWILRLAADGSVVSAGKISATSGRFQGSLADGDRFGRALAVLQDLDGDGRDELAVGAPLDDTEGEDRGAVWILFLDAQGTVRGEHEISDATEPLTTTDGGHFGWGLAAAPPDVGGPDLLIGVPREGISKTGAIWIVCLARSLWEDLGQGLAGGSGVPGLSGTGLLLADSPVTLSVQSARRDSPAFLVVGISAVQAPLAGGVLVPAPDVVLAGLATDDKGRLQVEGRWPSDVPAGVTLYVQAWIDDPAGPFGLAATNALAATAP